MLCRANLGTGRVTGEVIKRNSETVIMRLVREPANGPTVRIYCAGRKKGKPIKRHIEKHKVVFEEADGRE